jgi:hypothetical protein
MSEIDAQAINAYKIPSTCLWNARAGRSLRLPEMFQA